jgi:thiosulfate dehydrogenase [quinone] large subunit
VATAQRYRAEAAPATEGMGPVLTTAATHVLGIAFGLTFLWAFFDKLLALGYATGRDAETGVVTVLGDQAWVNGGSPTYCFLTFGAEGPLTTEGRQDVGQGPAGREVPRAPVNPGHR